MSTNRNALGTGILTLFYTPVMLYANDEFKTNWLEATTGIQVLPAPIR